MRLNEHYTTSCMLHNDEHLLIACTDRFGDGTTLVVWDVLGNEPLRRLRHEASVGLADHVTYLTVTLDDRSVMSTSQTRS